MSLVANAIKKYPECDPDQAISCRLTWKVTGNETVADLAAWVIGKPTAILILILIGLMVRWIVHRAIDQMVKHTEQPVADKIGRLGLSNSPIGSALRRNEATHTRRIQRARTMGSLLKSIATGVILAIVAMMAIAELGYNVAPLLASAGILGLALGFGAQALVRDFLSGIFMIFEDQYGVGDWVDLGEAGGMVEAVGLRVTRLRDTEGTVWYVRNGEIVRVGNMSQNWARTVLDVAVAYTEDLVRVRRVIAEVAHEMWEDPVFQGQMIEEPEVWGVQSISASGVLVRVAVKTAPQQQWAIGRELRQRIKARFDAEDIEVPYPDWVIRNGAGIQGTNPLVMPGDGPGDA